MNTKTLALVALLPLALAACVPCQTCGPVNANQVTEPQGFAAGATTLKATGHGAIGGSNSQLSSGQARLMAQRAARMDAYRNLAEQVYGFRVWGDTAVSSFATQSDNIRSYVDTFIRGARVISMSQLGDGTFEATIELELTPQFMRCVATTVGGPACRAPAMTVGTCRDAGCVEPSSRYFSVN